MIKHLYKIGLVLAIFLSFIFLIKKNFQRSLADSAIGITEMVVSISENNNNDFQKCLENEINLAFKTTNQSILFNPNEIVVLVNLYDIDTLERIKFAFLHKDSYASFMEDKTEFIPNGYFSSNGIIVVLFGNTRGLNFDLLDNQFEFLKPLEKHPIPNHTIPYPPSSVEPEIFKYEKTKNCYNLLERSMAIHLFKHD